MSTPEDYSFHTILNAHNKRVTKTQNECLEQLAEQLQASSDALQAMLGILRGHNLSTYVTLADSVQTIIRVNSEHIEHAKKLVRGIRYVEDGPQAEGD